VVDLEECSHNRSGTALICYTDEADVLSAMHFIAEAWRLITPTTIKNCFMNCGFSVDHVSSNVDSAMKLNEDEEVGWHSLPPLGVQFED
jgi:hypothetical protein